MLHLQLMHLCPLVTCGVLEDMTFQLQGLSYCRYACRLEPSILQEHPIFHSLHSTIVHGCLKLL